MSNVLADHDNYWTRLGQCVDSSWRRFWYTPSDPATVCVLRIVAGLMSLYYFASYWSDITMWFGPDGLLPRETVGRLATGFGEVAVYRFSLLQLSDDPLYLRGILTISIVAALMLTVGLFTRIVSVVTLLLLLSFVHRAPMITGQFEPVLTMIVLYLCLTPCGAKFSLDSLLRSRRAGVTNVSEQRSVAATIGLRLIQVHLAALHIMIGLNMLAGATWWAGEAVWWLMARSESRLIDITALGHSDGGLMFINLLTHAVVAYFLLYGIFIWRPLARPWLLAASIFVWGGIALLTGLVGYSLIMALTGVAYASRDS